MRHDLNRPQELAWCGAFAWVVMVAIAIALTAVALIAWAVIS
jgi:hypothetical protein